MVYISLTWGEMIKICVKVPKKNEFCPFQKYFKNRNCSEFVNGFLDESPF